MVSIIITYLDEYDFLSEAVQSALTQQVDEMELILVCNLPFLPDAYHPLPQYRDKYKLIHESTPGSAHARNAGLRFASGEWIQFLDVDDLILPMKISHQTLYAEADAVVSPHTYQYTNGKRLPSNWAPEDIWVGMLSGGLGSTSSMLWKRNALEAVGGWNTSYQSQQEYELLFRLISKGFNIIPDDHRETIVRERISGSITQLTKSSRAENGIRLREEMWQFITDRDLVNPIRLDAFRQYIFKQLRATFRRDPKGTVETFKKYFHSAGFMPKKSGIPFYNWIYRIFGFRNTETLFLFYTRMRDKYLPFLPVNK